MGALLKRQGCLLLASQDATYQLQLPDKYRVVRSAPARITTRSGSEIAVEGDVIGIDGDEIVSSGIFCMYGNGRIAVSKIITASPSGVSDRDHVWCQDVQADRCDRAIGTATSLAPWSPAEITTITVHPGICAISMFCSAVDRRFITVELTFPRHDLVFVTIDTRNGAWAATCNLLVVVDAMSSHTEPCPD